MILGKYLIDSKEERSVKFKIRLSILFLACVLTGCSLPLENKQQNFEGEDRIDTLGLTPDFSYDVTEQLPCILVNQLGYLPKESKVAVLQGNNLENCFFVYDAKTGEQVYRGTLGPDSLLEVKEENINSSEEIKKENYLADFSSVEKAGTYYLYQPDLGYSYQFKIEENLYDEIEKKLLSILEKQENDTSLICYQLTCLLFTKELYPGNLLEEERLDKLCRQKIEYLMQAQDKKTGSVYADIGVVNSLKDLDATSKQQYVSLAATAEFAGVMAKYAYLTGNTDVTFSNQCWQMAEKAYSSIQNSLDNVGYDAGYFAATHLYRLTGRGKYSRAIQQYMSMKEEQKSYTEYDFSLFGDYAYITLKKGTQIELGESLMKKIMSRAEEISLSSGRNNYYVSEKREYNDIDGKLRDMSNMALVNYVITNHEYSSLLKNYRDYLMGRNKDNLCFFNGIGMRNPEEEQAGIDEMNGGLFYLLLQAAKI